MSIKSQLWRVDYREKADVKINTLFYSIDEVKTLI
jgi:hypothetical protein